MTTLASVIGLLYTEVAAIDGINYAPNYPPEEPKDFPFAIVYPWDFTSDMNTPQDYKTLWNIRAELHIARKNMSDDVSSAIGFFETITTALYTVCVENAIAVNRISGLFGVLGYNEVPTVGFSWLMQEVKIVTSI